MALQHLAEGVSLPLVCLHGQATAPACTGRQLERARRLGEVGQPGEGGGPLEQVAAAWPAAVAAGTLVVLLVQREPAVMASKPAALQG